jgi:hypothetical protein
MMFEVFPSEASRINSWNQRELFKAGLAHIEDVRRLHRDAKIHEALITLREEALQEFRRIQRANAGEEFSGEPEPLDASEREFVDALEVASRRIMNNMGVSFE